MNKITKLLLVAIAMLLISSSSYSQANKAWWDGLSPEWQNFFKEKYMKKKQIEANVEMSESKLDIIVGSRNLNLSGNQEIKDLKPLTQFKNLETLDISGTNLENLSGLRNVPNIRELNCSNSELIEDLSPLRNMRRLEKLNCFNTSVANLEPIKNLALKELNVALCFIADNSLSSLENMVSLEKLDISENELIRNLGYMHKLENLVELNCSKSPVINVDSIAVLLNLEDLDISNTNIKSIKGLVSLKNLLEIDISDTQIKNIESLYASTALRTITALNLQIDDYYYDKLSQSIEIFEQKRPNCNVKFTKVD